MMTALSYSYRNVFDLNTTKRAQIVEKHRMEISSDRALFPCTNVIPSVSYDQVQTGKGSE
jgi:hypothetical protein